MAEDGITAGDVTKVIRFFNATGCLSAPNYIMPVHQYLHPNGCSVTGGYVCRSAKYQELYGKYFYADYCVSEIQYLEPDGIGGFNNTNLGMLGAVNVSGFGEDRHGNLYCTGLNSGNIYRIVSADCAPVATINFGNDTIDDCSTGSVNLFTATGIDHTYLWTLNGDTISNTDTVTATQEGMYVLHVSNQSCTNSDSVFVDFTSPVVLSFSGLDSVYCIFHPIDNLSPNILGGYFAGAGITNACFNPAAAGIGTFIITYFYTNSHGCTFSYSQSVFVDACTDVPENVWMNSISVYPNPSNGDFYARIYSQVEKNLNMKIIDVTGRIIFSEGMKLNPGENKIPVNTRLAKGIYILQFSDGDATKSLRVVMQ